LRLLYGAMRLLSPSWTDELHAATSDYQVRVFDRDLEKVVKTDVRIALELAAAAKYFTLVLDEPVAEKLPGAAAKPKAAKAQAKAGKAKADAGVADRDELKIQGRDHGVRIGIWELSSGKLLLRDHLEAGAAFVPMGRIKAASKKLLQVQQRQVNNCGIAADLRERVGAVLGGAADLGGASALAPGAIAAPDGSPSAATIGTGAKPAEPAASAVGQPEPVIRRDPVRPISTH
jgi:hypothetical protein